MKERQKQKVIALVYANLFIWGVFAFYIPYAFASSDFVDGETAHIQVESQPIDESPEVRAAEEKRICSDRFIVCGDGDSRSNSVATSRISTPVLSPSSPRMATISFYSAIDSCHYPAKGGCLTASGKIAKYGMVATNLYPFGTKIKIEGLGVFTVEDRISKRFNNRIDVWVGCGKEANVKAKQMGLQNKRIEIL